MKVKSLKFRRILPLIPYKYTCESEDSLIHLHQTHCWGWGLETGTSIRKRMLVAWLVPKLR